MPGFSNVEEMFSGAEGGRRWHMVRQGVNLEKVKARQGERFAVPFCVQ